MADGAGPSAAAGTGAVEEAVLQEAERKFERGIQCIRVRAASGCVWNAAPSPRRACSSCRPAVARAAVAIRGVCFRLCAPPPQTNDLEQAVQLFAEVLQVRTQHYGGERAQLHHVSSPLRGA